MGLCDVIQTLYGILSDKIFEHSYIIELEYKQQNDLIIIIGDLWLTEKNSCNENEFPPSNS